MEKKLLGIRIFGLIFIVLGISQLKFPLTYIMLYKTNKPITNYIYTGAANRISHIDKLISEKEKNLSKDEAAVIRQELDLLKHKTSTYKERYVDHRAMPLPVKLLILFSLISAALYVYTGYLIRNLKSAFQAYFVWSIVMGILVSFTFCWEIYSTVSSVIHLRDNFDILLSRINQVALPEVHANLYIVKTMRFPQILGLVILVNIIFVLAIVYYFNRPVVKEQFR